MFSAILLSGGKGTRLGKEIPKQYLMMAGKPIIMHSIERIDRIEEINELIIVCENIYRADIELMLEQYNIETLVKFAPAGASRQESVYHGLLEVENEYIILHEAARPFAVMEDYQELIREEDDNVMLGYQVPFTVLKGTEYVVDILDRSELVNVQLPQKFRLADLKRAHEKARKEQKQFTEDASLLYYYEKCKIKIITGRDYNIKITEPTDLITGEMIYNEYIAGRE